jgi:hypothetical protein
MKVNPAVRAFGWLLIALFVATFAAVVWLTVAGGSHAAHALVMDTAISAAVARGHHHK